jgi:quinol monooxygenase YgiN
LTVLHASSETIEDGTVVAQRILFRSRSTAGLAGQKEDRNGEKIVSNDIYWLCIFAVHPDQFDAFKAVVRPLAEMTRKEEGALAYEYYVSDDCSRIHIIEHYRDSEAVILHVQNTFAAFEERFTTLASVSSFVVYGSPNAAAREILDGFGAVYLTKFDGFTK